MSRKVLVNTKRNVFMLPGHPIILLKYNLYQYGDRNGKKVYWNSIKWSAKPVVELRSF